MLRFLVSDAGLAGDTPNNNGWTPLHVAAYGGHLPVVEYLVSTAQVDINTRSYGKTALQWALDQNKTDVAAFLRANGAHE